VNKSLFRYSLTAEAWRGAGIRWAGLEPKICLLSARALSLLSHFKARPLTRNLLPIRILAMDANGEGCVKVLAIETTSYSPATKLRILCQSYSLRS